MEGEVGSEAAIDMVFLGWERLPETGNGGDSWNKAKTLESLECWAQLKFQFSLTLWLIS